MTVIVMPDWEERIDPRSLSPKERTALARYYAAEMIGAMSLQGDCNELAAVLGIPAENNALQMIESWILQRLRLAYEVDLLRVVHDFRELYRNWSYLEACGLLGVEIDGHGNPIDDDED